VIAKQHASACDSLCIVSSTKSTIPFDELEDGQTTVLKVEGVDVLLCRVADRYYAISNRCSHANQPLTEGKLRGFAISCPLHGARFDVRDGKCMGGPAIRSIETFRVLQNGDEIIVSTSPD